MPTKSKYAYILRTCKADMSSPSDKARGFKWLRKGLVSAPDWDPSPRCGGGLHGALDGVGDGGLFCWDPDAVWLVVRVLTRDVVAVEAVDGAHPPKVKFPRGTVVHAGDRASATQYLYARRPGPIIGLVLTGGDGATVTGGDGATVTGGDGATVTGGVRATVTGGDGATVTGGVGATVTGGVRATVTGGDGATVTGGVRATVTGGDGATVTGGDGAILTLKWWDGARYRLAVAYVGESRIEPGVKYQIKDGEFVKA